MTYAILCYVMLCCVMLCCVYLYLYVSLIRLQPKTCFDLIWFCRRTVQYRYRYICWFVRSFVYALSKYLRLFVYGLLTVCIEMSIKTRYVVLYFFRLDYTLLDHIYLILYIGFYWILFDSIPFDLTWFERNDSHIHTHTHTHTHIKHKTILYSVYVV